MSARASKLTTRIPKGDFTTVVGKWLGIDADPEALIERNQEWLDGQFQAGYDSVMDDEADPDDEDALDRAQEAGVAWEAIGQDAIYSAVRDSLATAFATALRQIDMDLVETSTSYTFKPRKNWRASAIEMLYLIEGAHGSQRDFDMSHEDFLKYNLSGSQRAATEKDYRYYVLDEIGQLKYTDEVWGTGVQKAYDSALKDAMRQL